MCLFREFNKLILPGIKFSVLIRNMAPPQGEWGGGGGGAFAPNAPSWIRHWTGKFLFAIRIRDARTYLGPLHSRLPSVFVTLVHTFYRYILVHHRKRDARTYDDRRI